MKKLLLLLLTVSAGALFGQKTTSVTLSGNKPAENQVDLPAYKKDPNIPAFIIQQPDSTWFTAEQLPKYDYTAIIYFSPTCGHCQLTTQDLVKHMDSLRNVFFVFVSYSPMNEINEFYHYYNLNTLSNVRIGRDPKYFVPAFFHVEATPFVAVYDARRKLIKAFDPPNKPVMEAADLIALVHQK